jgi:hypothetical protein
MTQFEKPRQKTRADPVAGKVHRDVNTFEASERVIVGSAMHKLKASLTTADR